MGLIPRTESVQNFCSQSDLESFRQFRCIGLAAEVNSPESLPQHCEELIKSMSAKIHNGAVGEWFRTSSRLSSRAVIDRREGKGQTHATGHTSFTGNAFVSRRLSDLFQNISCFQFAGVMSPVLSDRRAVNWEESVNVNPM